MNNRKNEQRDRLIEAAKKSTDPTVKAALDKLLFTVSLAHNEEYVKWAANCTFTSGCTITVPATEHTTTFQLCWNEANMQVHALEFVIEYFEYGHFFGANDPMPGIILQKDLNI